MTDNSENQEWIPCSLQSTRFGTNQVPTEDWRRYEKTIERLGDYPSLHALMRHDLLARCGIHGDFDKAWSSEGYVEDGARLEQLNQMANRVTTQIATLGHTEKLSGLPENVSIGYQSLLAMTPDERKHWFSMLNEICGNRLKGGIQRSSGGNQCGGFAVEVGTGRYEQSINHSYDIECWRLMILEKYDISLLEEENMQEILTGLEFYNLELGTSSQKIIFLRSYIQEMRGSPYDVNLIRDALHHLHQNGFIIVGYHQDEDDDISIPLFEEKPLLYHLR